MKSQITLTCDIYNACRTNTARARKSDGHYNFQLLVQISGAKFDDLIADLNNIVSLDTNHISIYSLCI